LTIDKLVEKVVDKNLQRKLLFTTSFGWALVAAYVMIMSFTISPISNEWDLSMQLSSLLASSTFIGMFFGALIAGNLADLIGRKKTSIFFLSVGIVFAFLVYFTNSPESFIIVRILSGIGFGGLLPSLNAYLSEFLSIGIRGKYLVYLETSWAFGSIYIGIIHLLFGSNINWKIDYVSLVIGIIPLIILLKIPESPKYLIVNDKMNLFKKYFNFIPKEKIEIEKSKKVSFLNLFTKKYLKRTLNVYLLWFTMSFGYYGVFIWVKGILLSKGISLVQSDWFTFYMFLAQLPGYLLSAYLIEKIGRKPSLLLFSFGTAFSALFFAFSNSPSMVIVSSLIVSIFCMGAWGLTYAFTPELYPTNFRGAANGSSAALTRLAGFIAPFYTSYFLAKDMIYLGLIGISILFIITGILNYIFLPETKNKEVY